MVPAPVAGVKSAEVFVGPTGRGKTANSPMTVTRRIRRRGEHGISRKTIAQGRRNAPTVPVCSCACSCAHIARETAGAASTRRSLRPLSLGETICKARAKRAAGMRRCVLVGCERRRTPPPFEASAALRHLRVTATRERWATATKKRHPCATAARERHPEVRASSASLEGWRGQRNDKWGVARGQPRHSSALRQHRTLVRHCAPENLEFPALVLRTIPE